MKGHIYLVRIQDKITGEQLPYVKIGKAKVLEDRIKGLNDWPVIVPIANVYEAAWEVDNQHTVESELHDWFKRDSVANEYHVDEVIGKVEKLMLLMYHGIPVSQQRLNEINERVLSGRTIVDPDADDYSKIMEQGLADEFLDALLSIGSEQKLFLHRTQNGVLLKDNKNRLKVCHRNNGALLSFGIVMNYMQMLN